MTNALLVLAGGGLGALARYWLTGVVHRNLGSVVPYGTVAVNIAGCFVIGVLMVALEDRFLVNPSLRVFLAIGILGGFTTFSSFSYETIALLRDGEFLYGCLNVLISVGACLGATYAGTLAGKLL